jgi:hypothetical protein
MMLFDLNDLKMKKLLHHLNHLKLKKKYHNNNHIPNHTRQKLNPLLFQKLAEVFSKEILFEEEKTPLLEEGGPSQPPKMSLKKKKTFCSISRIRKGIA